MAAVPTARADTIDSAQLGFALMNEMVFGPVSLDLQANWPQYTSGDPESQRRQEDAAVRNLHVAKEFGVDTLLDRSLPGIGRDVARLKRVAERSPVNIIVCTGFYTWHELPFAFKFKETWGDRLKLPALAELFVEDIEVGIRDTGVRAGMIKAVTDRYGLVPDVLAALRAAAAAHRRTGVPITTHTAVSVGAKTGALQQQAFAEAGVDLSRVILGHVDFTPPDAELKEFEALMDRGSLIGFDTVGFYDAVNPSAWEITIARVTELIKRGYADRILLSHDGCPFSDITPEDLYDDGYPVYTAVSQKFLPALRERGISDAIIEQMMVGNPRRIFASRDLGPY
jgi:phosphotriesterase-related protein